MPEVDATQAVAAAATAAPAVSKPSEAVADAAKTVAEESPKEDATLLGDEGKKDGVVATPEVKAVVPEKYEIKAPEGMTVDQGLLDTVTPIFKELGISQEGAQKLADAYAPQVSKMLESQKQEAINGFQKMVTEWKDQTTKDLGANGAKELAHAAKFIDRFGGTELRQVLNETGLGNHPIMVKAFIAAGKAIANDSFPDSSNKGKSLDTEDAKAATLFPTQK